ncbi:MAG: acyltransferase [Betaproteobacteria bacterium]|nr:MAG: acyltransferase [Betaproteobacteria bacterium]
MIRDEETRFPTTLRRLHSFDGIRGIAVLLVFLSHTSGRNQAAFPSLNFAGIGHIGVYLFFVLSGFLLALGLFRVGINRDTLRAFYVRRIFRIIPLYAVVLVAVFSAQLLSGRVEERYLHIGDGWIGLIQHLFIYRGDGVFWTIAVEMQFYLVLPVIAWSLIRFRRAAVLTLLVVAVVNEALYTAKFLVPDFENPIVYLSPNYRDHGTFIGIFACGVIAAYAAHFHQSALIRWSKWLNPLALVAFLTLLSVTLFFVSWHFLGNMRPYYDLRFWSPLYGATFAIFLVSVFMGNPMTRWLNSSLLRTWGILGFSIYLLHMFVIAIVNQTGFPPPIKLAISGVCVIALAKVTYDFIERPFMDLSYRISDQRWSVPALAPLVSHQGQKNEAS